MGRLAQFIGTLRMEGPRRAVVKAGAATCCSRLIVLEFDFDQPPATPPADSHLAHTGPRPDAPAISRLTSADVDDYAAMLPNARFDLLTMLDTGRMGFGSWVDGRLVAVHWAAFGTVFVPYLHRSLTLAKDQALIEGSFVPPELRGQGLAGAGAHQRFALLREVGIRRVIALVQPENRAGLRSPEKLDYRQTVTLYAVGIGSRRHTFAIGRRDDRTHARHLIS